MKNNATSTLNIHDAARKGDLERVKALVTNNPSLVYYKNNGGDTPLHIAAVTNHLEIVEFLLDNNADINCVDIFDATPLHLAAREGRKAVVSLLLAKGANINAKDNSGSSPLHCAAFSNHKQVVELLLENKADINAKNNFGVTALASLKKKSESANNADTSSNIQSLKLSKELSEPLKNATSPIKKDEISASAAQFAGKTEVKWLIIIGIGCAVAYSASLIANLPQYILIVTGVFAGVFFVPLALIIISVILAGIVQIFTPGGGKGIPLFGWKGGIDGLSLSEVREFEAKQRLYRFLKVYLYLLVNSLVGAVMALGAFGALYIFMQFVQHQKH